jgi:hypothetical protein
MNILKFLFFILFMFPLNIKGQEVQNYLDTGTTLTIVYNYYYYTYNYYNNPVPNFYPMVYSLPRNYYPSYQNYYPSQRTPVYYGNYYPTYQPPVCRRNYIRQNYGYRRYPVHYAQRRSVYIRNLSRTSSRRKR